MAFASGATAADITLYYSPTCPHCHHAREFISGALVYEYPSLKVEAVNVMEQENLPAFQAALEKCKYESGGVPVMVIGDECMQGYAEVLNDDMRKYVEAGMSDDEKNSAAQIRKEMETDAQKVRDAHKDRADAITERSAAVQKKSDGSSSLYFYGILIVLVLGLGFVLMRRGKGKK
jgi:glutaredoxin